MRKVVFLDIDGVLNSNFWNENHQREIRENTTYREDGLNVTRQRRSRKTIIGRGAV